MLYNLAGKETVHQHYGTRAAVLAGDFMFAQSSCAQSSWYLANLENIEIIKLISSVGLLLHSVYPSIYSPVYNLGVLALCYILFNFKKSCN